MKLTLRTSTGAKILVWREAEEFHARRADSAQPPQVCLAIDLFEVIAELAGLDLEQGAEAAEAIELAEDAQLRLGLSDFETDIDYPGEHAEPGAG